MIIFYFIIFSIALSLVSYSMFYILRKVFYVNLVFIKNKRKVSKQNSNKLILSSKQDVNIAKNISNNYPRIEESFSLEKCKLFLSKFNINFDHPVYLINVTNNTSIKNIYSELQLLKQFENNAVYLNVIILTSCDVKRAYNLKYFISQLDFINDVIGIYPRENLSSIEYMYLNMLNINYYCGMHFGETIAKNKDYCIKNKENIPFNREMNSTMQNCVKQRYVLCNKYIEKCKTYNYITDTEITRFDFSCSEGKEVVSCFIPFFDLKFFRVEVHNFYIKIKNFVTQKEFFYTSNKPIFSNAIFNKKGIYFSFVNNSNFVYIFKANEHKEFSSILECEREFLRAQTLLNCLPKVNVKSNNYELDEMVNTILPQNIVKLALNQENLDKELFKNFCNLSSFDFWKKYEKTQLFYTIEKYFNMLSTYYGIKFGKGGIYLSKNKDKLLSSNIQFKKGLNNYSINILNKHLNSETFAFNGVEYTGINYLPFNKLSQSLNLQM